MLRAKGIMTKNVVSVRKDIRVRDICRVLIKYKLSGLPVVDRKGNLVGFISQRDIIAKVSLQDFQDMKAEDLMVKKVIYVSGDTPCDQISRIFSEKPYHYLPVIKTRRVIGIISPSILLTVCLGNIIEGDWDAQKDKKIKHCSITLGISSDYWGGGDTSQYNASNDG